MRDATSPFFLGLELSTGACIERRRTGSVDYDGMHPEISPYTFAEHSKPFYLGVELAHALDASVYGEPIELWEDFNADRR